MWVHHYAKKKVYCHAKKPKDARSANAIWSLTMNDVEICEEHTHGVDELDAC